MTEPPAGRRGGRGDRFVLAVDLGSSVAKVGLVSLDGAVAWWSRTELSTERGPDGSAVQDAQHWWRVVVDSARRGMSAGTVGGDQVVAVAVTGQWSSTVPVDTEGHPVGPCLMWSDTRGARHSRAMVAGHLMGYRARAAYEWVRRTGGIPRASGGDALGNLLHLERDGSGPGRAAAYYLEPVDYLTARFTGVVAATHASVFSSWLTDNRDPDVMAYDARLLRLAGLDDGKLPPLVPTGSVVGPVLPAVAEELGISSGAVVVTGVPDLHAAAVAAGSVGDYEAHLAVGTTAWVACPLPAMKVDVLRAIGSVPGLWPGQYLMLNNQRTAGRCLDWLRAQVIGPADGLSTAEPPTYDELVALAGTVPAGSDGVIFTPWLDGEDSPFEDARARAGFHNLSLGSTRAHLVRAVMEGVAFNARWLLEAADHFTGRRLDPVRLLGGGTQSDLWCQIIADVTDRTVERVADPVVSGIRGAALFAGMTLGEVDREEVRALVPVDAVFAPDPVVHTVYDRLFAEFPRLYKAQRGMFRRLNRS
jgi:xylulokinase